ncbi:hypothetical protein AVEN_263677-1 [Araneus ventricosus]|uniref:Uncharacterized protein n=1 Tax=Araneus ventricosus TaxID=182803 RepID=A0A4Y2ATL0_ARAVE|nr:hypothetical protein AVEN_263677-1 [Araneus ventricosus]
MQWGQILSLWMATSVITVQSSRTNTEKQDITRPKWPAFASDSNPVENMIGRLVPERYPPLRSIPKLRIALIQDWDGLSHVQLDNLVLRIPRCFIDCLSEDDKHTAH